MNINANDRTIVNRNKIQEIVNQVDPRYTLDPEVEDILLELADEFMDSVTGFACALAKHRNGETLEVKDLELHLDMNYGMKIPMLEEELQQTETRKPVTDLHEERLKLVRKSEQKRARKKQ